MSWREVGVLVLLIAALNVIGVVGGASAQGIALGLLLLGILVVTAVRRRTARRRFARLAVAAEAERDAELQALPEDDRSAYRAFLGLVDRTDAHVDPAAGEEFAYRQTPATVWRLTFWGSAFISASAAVALISGNLADASERPWALVLAAGFLVNAFATERSRVNSMRRYRLTPSGVVQLNPDGTRVGILWSDVLQMRRRRWLGRFEIVGIRPHERIDVDFSLERLGRFVELVVAYLRDAEARAA